MMSAGPTAALWRSAQQLGELLKRERLMLATAESCTALTLIGSMTCGDVVEVVGEPDFDATLAGYDHFPGVLDP